MRVYLPLSAQDLTELAAGLPIDLSGRTGVSPTAEFAATVESDDAEELELIAALAASDLESDTNAVGVIQGEAAIVDAELGEVACEGSAALGDFECLLLADVDTQELSWFGVQELTQLQQHITPRSK